MAWNPTQYLQFSAQRTQPAQDLASRLNGLQPRTVLDAGCGPANSTLVLRTAFPQAALTGIDTSPQMLEKARKNLPDAQFIQQSAASITESYDIIFSNACLQWLPDHEALIPFLFSHVREGGALAVQVPMNQDEPLFKIIRRVTHEKRWQFDPSLHGHNTVLEPERYFDILSGITERFDIWETVYYHALPDHASLVEWVKATRLLPYLDALESTRQADFLDEILTGARGAYPVTQSGQVILRFRRLFFTAFRQSNP